ncbi:MAG TPA: NHL repeat-containing protein [Anaerolineae bacterium]|nr:NHL repeat-containing protein [Anaerolineae bacterium]HQI87564.1 NHL repeat-containing protein [Anaerolineae bacterium]
MKKWLPFCLVICILLSSACRASSGTALVPPTTTVRASAPEAAATATAFPPTTTPITAPTVTTAPPPTPIPIPPGADKGYRQWAIAASASSAYSDPDHSARQATGKPDTLVCGDAPSAWSPAEADGVAWLELSFDVPTVPTLINIIQTNNPSQIVKVELIDFTAEYHEIYTARPYAASQCPYTLSIPVEVDYQIGGLRITVNHSVLKAGRAAIDAVEVIGSVERPVIPADTTTAEVLWRVGSTSPELAELSFTMLGGMDATDSAVYVADAYNGAYIFDLEGSYQGQLAQGEIGYVADVKVGPDGAVYLAELGFRQIVHFNAEGDLLGAFGGYGTGDGEFSGESPAALAVDLDGNIYALDVGEVGTRVQVFSAEGEFLRNFPVETELSVKAMDIGPDGTLFLTGAGGYILELAPDDGRVIRRLGMEALADSFPQMLSLDAAGNFYVVTWSPPGAVKLDAQGQWLERIGVEATNDGVTGWPAGEFLFPVGIAVTGDGRYLFIGDGIGEFAFLTAYHYP